MSLHCHPVEPALKCSCSRQTGILTRSIVRITFWESIVPRKDIISSRNVTSLSSLRACPNGPATLSSRNGPVRDLAFKNRFTLKNENPLIAVSENRD